MSLYFALTHWGRVTHICVSNLTTIGLDNGLPPVRCEAITWTIADRAALDKDEQTVIDPLNNSNVCLMEFSVLWYK